jgi:hypothetical protein
MSGQSQLDPIGAVLRQERERRYISLDAVSRGTLVRVDFLELIEEDRLEELPSGAYARGFIRSYASYLGLDPAPFLQAHERRFAPLAPELSQAMRRGVRVPPDAQRRAWTVAVSSAVVVIALLALFGVFRSDEGPVEIPDVAVLSSAPASDVVPNAMGAVVRLDVVGDQTWVEVVADGQPVFARVMDAGETMTFRGSERVEIFVARGDQIHVLSNGRAVGIPEPGPYRGVFSPSTDQLPQSTHDEEPPAAQPHAPPRSGARQGGPPG